MKNESMTIITRYTNGNCENCIVLHDYYNELMYNINLFNPQKTVIYHEYCNGISDLVERLLEAESIEFIHNEYIQGIEQDIFESEYDKEKAYNLLLECYYNKRV
jgi:hypothetical protein